MPSYIRLFATPGTVAHQAPLSMGCSRQEYGSGLPFPSPGDLPAPGTEPASPALQADSSPLSQLGSPATSLCPETSDGVTSVFISVQSQTFWSQLENRLGLHLMPLLTCVDLDSPSYHLFSICPTCSLFPLVSSLLSINSFFILTFLSSLHLSVCFK